MVLTIPDGLFYCKIDQNFAIPESNINGHLADRQRAEAGQASTEGRKFQGIEACGLNY